MTDIENRDFSDPCRECRWWLMVTPDYRRCERGASPSYAAQLGRCAKRESKSDSVGNKKFQPLPPVPCFFCHSTNVEMPSTDSPENDAKCLNCFRHFGPRVPGSLEQNRAWVSAVPKSRPYFKNI